MQQEVLLVGAFQRIDELLVLAGAERRHHEGLGLAAGEQRRAVGARQHADLGNDRAHGLEVAPVDAAAGIEDVPAHDLGFEVLEDRGEALLVGGGLAAFGRERGHHLGLGGLDRVMARHLVGDRIGGAQILLDDAEHLFLELGIVRHFELARLFRGLLGEADDRLDHRLEMTVAEHHGAEHDLLGQLLRFGFHHQHRVLGAGDDEVEIAFGHLVDLRIEDVFVVDEADPRRADRAHERRAGERQRRRRRHHGEDVGAVLLVVRHGGHDDLGVAAPAVGEQRADRAVDQARHQRFALARPSLALEIAAGNAARGEELFLVVAGQRQEIDAFLRLLRRDDGGEHGGLAIGGDDGAIGLARYPAGFENELAPAPIELLTMNVEHLCFLSWFCGHESHEQDGERLRRTAGVRSGAASGDPAMTFMPFAHRTIFVRALRRPRPPASSDGCNQAPADIACSLARRPLSGGSRASRSGSCSSLH